MSCMFLCVCTPSPNSSTVRETEMQLFQTFCHSMLSTVIRGLVSLVRFIQVTWKLGSSITFLKMPERLERCGVKLLFLIST